MSILSVQNLSMSFAQREVFSNVSFDVAKGDRVGFIGANGSGKTTLFKIITGEYECTEGGVFIASGAKVGFAEQHACKNSELNVYEEMLTVFASLSEMEAELDSLHSDIDKRGGLPELIERQSALTEEFLRLDGLTYKARARSCLLGLGFTEENLTQPVSLLSGGQRTKLALGKLLLSSPDLMLLDEPTNHLDLESVEWLEDFMGKFNGTAIIISHDRYFLDKVTTRTVELERHRARTGKGGYSVYIKLKEEQLESERREYERAAEEIKRIEAMIAQQIKFGMERNYVTIDSKKKQIERIRAGMPELPPRAKDMKLRLTASSRSGDEVIMAHDLKKGFGAQPLFEHVELTVYRGERVCLLGPNGCGKTTLLSVLTGKLRQDEGYSHFGANVHIGYYDQKQTGLDSDRSIIMEVYERFPRKTIPELRGYLGQFLFSGDDIEKKMCDLSGGERARVALLILILSEPNLLILDEPTNHLDIQSREVLENALADYDGTILAVSHDRYFVNRIANKLLIFDGTSIKRLDGNYDSYVGYCAGKAAEVPQENRQEKKVNEYQLRREAERNERKRLNRIKKIEENIEALELEKEELTNLLSTPEVAADYEKIIEYSNRLDEISKEYDTLSDEWLELN